MKNLTLTFRITALVVLLLVALLLVSIMLVGALRGVIQAIESDNELRQYSATVDSAWQTFEFGYLKTADIGNRFSARQVELGELEQAAQQSRLALQALQQAVNSLSPHLRIEWQSYLADAGQLKAQMQTLDEDIQNLSSSFEALYVSWEAKAGFVERKKTEKQMGAALEQVDLSLKSLNQLYHQFLDNRSTESINANKQRVSLTVAMGIGSFLIAVTLSGLLLHGVRKQLSQILVETNALANGDLTRQIDVQPHRNEINNVKRAVFTVQDRLQSMFASINGLSEKLKTASGAINEDIMHHLDGAGLQQEKSETIVGIFEQISIASENVGSNAQITIEQADSARALAEKCVGIVDDTITLIEQLAEDISAAVTEIGHLNVQAENIQDVVSVINNIAEQTNLLALNAAIEAARAGEQGRGFAVVADEVRTLATRTQKSTEEIQATLAGLTQGTGKAVATVENNQRISENSVAKVSEASDVIRQITSAIEQMRQASVTTVDASQQQQETLHTAQSIINEVADIARSNVERAQASTKQTDELNEVSEHILQSISEFKLR